MIRFREGGFCGTCIALWRLFRLYLTALPHHVHKLISLYTAYSSTSFFPSIALNWEYITAQIILIFIRPRFAFLIPSIRTLNTFRWSPYSFLYYLYTSSPCTAMNMSVNRSMDRSIAYKTSRRYLWATISNDIIHSFHKPLNIIWVSSNMFHASVEHFW